MAQKRVHPQFRPAIGNDTRPSRLTPCAPSSLITQYQDSVKQKVLTDMVQELVKTEWVQERHIGEYGFFSRLFLVYQAIGRVAIGDRSVHAERLAYKVNILHEHSNACQGSGPSGHMGHLSRLQRRVSPCADPPRHRCTFIFKSGTNASSTWSYHLAWARPRGCSRKWWNR